jgi:ribosomal protein S18 acetylase RimI-like enzyme
VLCAQARRLMARWGVEELLGESGVYSQMHPDWRADQQGAVQAACSTERIHVWVAELDTVVAGFVAARLDHKGGMGEIYMSAADPAYQKASVPF